MDKQSLESKRRFIEVLLIVVTLLVSLKIPTTSQTNQTVGDVSQILVLAFLALSILYYSTLSNKKFQRDKILRPLIIFCTSATLAAIIGISFGLSVVQPLITSVGPLDGILSCILIALAYYVIFTWIIMTSLDTTEAKYNFTIPSFKKFFKFAIIYGSITFLFFEVLQLLVLGYILFLTTLFISLFIGSYIAKKPGWSCTARVNSVKRT